MITRQLHDGMLGRVQDSGVTSDPFEVTNGVKQGCVLAPTLFSLMFSAMLTDAFRDADVGIGIRYRFDEPFSTSGGYKQNPRSQQTLSTTFCLLMIVPSTLPLKRTCNAVHTYSRKPVTTLVSQSAPRRPR